MGQEQSNTTLCARHHHLDHRDPRSIHRLTPQDDVASEFGVVALLTGLDKYEMKYSLRDMIKVASRGYHVVHPDTHEPVYFTFYYVCSTHDCPSLENRCGGFGGFSWPNSLKSKGRLLLLDGPFPGALSFYIHEKCVEINTNTITELIEGFLSQSDQFMRRKMRRGKNPNPLDGWGSLDTKRNEADPYKQAFYNGVEGCLIGPPSDSLLRAQAAWRSLRRDKRTFAAVQKRKAALLKYKEIEDRRKVERLRELLEEEAKVAKRKERRKSSNTKSDQNLESKQSPPSLSPTEYDNLVQSEQEKVSKKRNKASKDAASQASMAMSVALDSKNAASNAVENAKRQRVRLEQKKSAACEAVLKETMSTIIPEKETTSESEVPTTPLDDELGPPPPAPPSSLLRQDTKTLDELGPPPPAPPSSLLRQDTKTLDELG
eukprot:g956.t1